MPEGSGIDWEAKAKELYAVLKNLDEYLAFEIKPCMSDALCTALDLDRQQIDDLSHTFRQANDFLMYTPLISDAVIGALQDFQKSPHS